MHLELESELADFLNKESVVTFSTGFQTNLGIISALVGHGDYVICDKENHASIYDGCKLSYGRRLLYRHNDMDELERILKGLPEDSGKLIVTDGVFSMGGDIAKLPEIVALAKKYGARTMVDDAHALGVIGRGGRGTADHFGLADEVDIYMGTFSKSLASLGGYMASSAPVAEYVRHTSRPVHLLGLDPAGKLRDGAGCAAASARAPGDRRPARGNHALCASGHARARHPHPREQRRHPHHPDLHKRRYDHALRRESDLRRGRLRQPRAAAGRPGKRLPAAHQLYGHPHRGAAGRGAGHHPRRARSVRNPMSLRIAVTGGSSGIGLAIARQFAAKGHTVYSLSRRPSADGVRHIPCDVADESSVRQAFAALEQAEGALDILVNNAGFGISGAAEFTDLDKAKALFDVGYFGLLACVKHALPLLRKSASPLIVNVGSLAAALPVPFQSVYSSAKAAVSALTLCLVNELRPFGVRVCAVLPGDVRTGFTAKRDKSQEGRALYGDRLERAVARMEADEQNGMPPERIAAAVCRAAMKRRPKPLFTVGAGYKTLLVLSRLLPARWVNRIEGRLYG